MKTRFALLLSLALSVASAETLRITFSGTGAGALNGQAFASTTFTFNMTIDTTLVTKPMCCDSLDTQSGAPTTFTITGVGSGTLNDNQVIFIFPNTGALGLAHFNDGDVIDIQSPLLKNYKLDSSI